MSCFLTGSRLWAVPPEASAVLGTQYWAGGSRRGGACFTYHTQVFEDAMLVPRAKATKSPLSRVRSGRVTKSGTSSSAKSRVRSASVEELVTSDQALADPVLPDPALPDSESPLRCPVEGCNWVHGMKGGKKSPQGSLCHHIKYSAFRGSTDPKKAAVDKAHREVHDQNKEDRSKSHQIHFVPRP
jgi:hypothetical protein